MFKPKHTSHVQSLAVQWSLLAMKAVAFARQVSMMTKMGSHSGARKAELLEAWIYAALIKLSADIARASDTHHSSKDDRAALAHLKTVHAMLSMVALLMAAIKRDLSCAAEMLLRLAGAPPIAAMPLRRGPVTSPAFLDSS